MGWRIEQHRRRRHTEYSWFHGDGAETRARRDFDERDTPGDLDALLLIRRHRDGSETVEAER